MLVGVFKKFFVWLNRQVGVELPVLVMLSLSCGISSYFFGFDVAIGGYGFGLVPTYISAEIANFIIYSTVILFIVRWFFTCYFPTWFMLADIFTFLWFGLAFFRLYTVSQIDFRIGYVISFSSLCFFFLLFLYRSYKRYIIKNTVINSISKNVISGSEASRLQKIRIPLSAGAATFALFEQEARKNRAKISLFLHENLGFGGWATLLMIYNVQSVMFWGYFSFWALAFWAGLFWCVAMYMAQRNDLLPQEMLQKDYFSKKYYEYLDSFATAEGVLLFKSSDINQAPNGAWRLFGSGPFYQKLGRGLEHLNANWAAYSLISGAVGGVGVYYMFAQDFKVRKMEVSAYISDVESSNKSHRAYQKSQQYYQESQQCYQESNLVYQRYLNTLMYGKLSVNSQLASEVADNSGRGSQDQRAAPAPFPSLPPPPPMPPKVERPKNVDVDVSDYVITSSADEVQWKGKTKGKVRI